MSAGTVVVLAALAGFLVGPSFLRGGSAHAASAKPPARAKDGRPTPSAVATASSAPHGCPNIQFTRYSLGSSFHGLPLTYGAIVCDRPPGHAGPTVPFSDVIYGTCKAVSDYGCPAPLEIQSWPQCRRNYSSYSNGPLDRALNPSALTRIRGLPTLPAAMFDDNTRLELYTGDTTVVVFGDDAPQLMTVGASLAQRMVPHIAAAVLGRSARAASLSSASALTAAIDTPTAARALRTKALGAPPQCTAG